MTASACDRSGAPGTAPSAGRLLAGASCIWLTPVLGVEGRLLYYGPLLREFARSFRRFRVLTAEFKGDAAAAGFEIERCGGFRRLYANERVTQQKTTGYVTGFSVATPAVLGRLLRDPPDLLVLNEFSLFSLYGALFRLLRPRTRILLIAETRPRLGGRKAVRLARRALRKVIAQAAHAALTNNEAGRAYLVDELGVGPERVLAQPYLVSDLGARLTAPPRRRPANPVRFLCVGQLIVRKGVHLALESFGQLRARCPQGWVVDIAGDGPARAELEALTTRLGLDDRVRFRGRVPYDELPGVFADADAFVFPTLSDYRALAPFEAISCGLPVLASVHDGGAAEAVTHGENGFLFQPERPAELADQLERLLNEPGLFERFAEQSRKRAGSYTLAKAVATLRTAAANALSPEPLSQPAGCG